MKTTTALLLGFLAIGCAKKMTDGSVSTPSQTANIAKQSIKTAYGKLPKNEFVDNLLSKMTIEEKIGQMTQYNGFWDVSGPPPSSGSAGKKVENIKAGLVGSMLNVTGVDNVMKLQKLAVENSRLGIPLIFGQDVIHGFKTLAPIPLAEAASWDPSVATAAAKMAAAEASASGINWTFAPMMDISRDARWGRVMEGGGEDPFLGAKFAAARVKGFQGEKLGSVSSIAACAKHFAGYGFAESGRDYNSVDISKSTLHNIVLPPFKAAVDAGVATVMNAFNDLNGVPATANEYLLRDILKDKWNFKGFVVSDWNSIGELAIHGVAADNKQAAEIAAKAGSDMDMETYAYQDFLPALVREGRVSETHINEAAKRVLLVKYELGLFQDPYKFCNKEREKEVVYNAAHRTVVRDGAKKSIVLLKNQGQLLPLKKGSKVALIGPFVKDKNSPLGSWRLGSDDNTAVSLWEGMQATNGYNLSFSNGVNATTKNAIFIEEVEVNTKDTSGFAAAIATAKSSDVVVLNIGEHGFQSGEGRSRTNINIPSIQEELMKAIYAVNKNIVLVLQTGRPLDISWASENIPSIVVAWQLGTESGNAIADVLTGAYNPSGKLPMSFPRNVGQVPIFYNQKSTGRPTGYVDNAKMVFWSHYSDVEKTALYPFGYGLSYTDFDYSNFTAVKGVGNTINVSVTLTNKGKLTGEETVQLYIKDKVSSITRPVKELKGFQKVGLESGASKTVSFVLTEKELGYYNDNGDWFFESGDFDVMIGGNSADVKSITVKL